MAANRTKTIEYMLPMLSTAATYQGEGTTYLDSGDTTIYIPETTDRAFKSVTLEVFVHDNHATVSANLAGWGLRASCDGGTTWTTATIASTYNQSGENIGHLLVADVTAEFTARFSGASDTVRWGFYCDYSATGPTLANASAKLIITYDYDDTAHATRVKTVRIPIESFNGRLSNSAQALKQTSTTANQLPALKHASAPFLPEDSTTIRQAFCELWTNTLPSATTDAQLYLKVDTGGSETIYGLIENGNASPINLRVLYDVTSVDWTSAHELYARHNNASESHFVHLGGWLTVTYEYNHTNSTTILNSLLLAMGNSTLNLRASGDDDGWGLDYLVAEPTTIALVQSGIFVIAQTGTTSGTLNFKAGGQTATGYTPTAATGMAGFISLMHRIDSGGHRGAGITLARGENSFTAEAYGSSANLYGNLSGLMFLNYTSGKHTSGDGAHAHSVNWMLRTNNIAVNTDVIFSMARTPTILESLYNLHGVSLVVYQNGFSAATSYGQIQAELASGEGFNSVGKGWEELNHFMCVSPNERMPIMTFAQCLEHYREWSGSLNTHRMNIETARSLRFYGISIQLGLGLWVTYSSMSHTIAGTISGYVDADGAGLTVKLYRADTGEYIGSATTTAGGAFTFTWHNSAIEVFAELQEDATHVGRSANSTAT